MASGYKVHLEPKIQSNKGLKKPDIIAKLGTTAIIIDAQVINDKVNLDDAHTRKYNYYKNIDNLVKEKYEVNSTVHTLITLSWRGVRSQSSAADLVSRSVLRKSILSHVFTSGN